MKYTDIYSFVLCIITKDKITIDFSNTIIYTVLSGIQKVGDYNVATDRQT